MEKMIKVINDNLRTVINGIKTHKADTEASLTTIKGKMDERVKLAGEYRSNVEDARQIISSLESEISTLDNDLNDLKHKFSSKDFKEIVVVGSKEINNKIAEKKSLIAEQSQKIIALTDKAHKLKNELVSLKEKKLALEATLEKDNILEAYYENRIMEVIKFSEEHVADLKEYIDAEPQTTLMTSTNEVENIDISNAIDGSVFEEIDEISNSTDSDDLSQYINGVLDEGTIDLTDIEVDDEEDDSSDELYGTQQIDDIISEANTLLEKSKSLETTPEEEEMEVELPEEEPTPYVETINLDDVATPAPLYIEEEPQTIEVPEFVAQTDEDEEDGGEEGLTLSLSDEEDEEEMEIEMPEMEEDNDVAPYQPDAEEETTDEQDEEALLNSEDARDMFPTIDDVPEVSIDNGVGNLGELNLATPEDLDLEEDNEYNEVDEENMFSALADFNNEEVNVENDPLEEREEEIDVPIITPVDEQDNTEEVKKEIEEANLDLSKFDDEVVEKIAAKYNKGNILNIVNTMRKHNIAIAKIYDNAHIVANMTSEELDYVLTLLEKTNASSDSLSYVIGLLDRVDIYKLEEKLSSKTNYELSELLYGVVPYEGEVDLAEKFNLNPSEVNILRSVSPNEEYEMINQFCDIFEANYNELKKYNVNNLNECIVKHPHRFLFNPDNFAAILDKYDPEDLTRCVNKNAAVIDKL